MDNLIEQVNQMLSDPESMKKVMEFASVLGIPDTNVPENTFSEQTYKNSTEDDKQQALVRALLPYLQPKHQQRLQKAVSIAKISKTAEAVIRSGLLFKEKEGGDNGI